MIASPPCPLCDEAGPHEPIKKQVFGRGDSGISAYTAKRYKVLFDLWAPGNESIEITYVLCKRCGFVMYAPRPTAEELAAKYQQLGGATSSTVNDPVATRVDVARSDEVLGFVGDYLAPGAAVLDYGGGTGSLMTSFVDQGFACSVVDYAPAAIAGVERLATTIDEVAADRRFDLIVALHIIEHVADPVAVMRSLRARIRPGGHVFVEVPLELVGGAPKRDEPVTHVNFFTEATLSALCQRAGFDVTRCETAVTTHASGKHCFAIIALAKRLEDQAVVAEEAVVYDPDSVRKLVSMGPVATAAFFARKPSVALNPLRRLRAKRGW